MFYPISWSLKPNLSLVHLLFFFDILTQIHFFKRYTYYWVRVQCPVKYFIFIDSLKFPTFRYLIRDISM